MSNTVKVLGRYELHEEIAHGGMAVVHVGRQIGDAGFSRVVAIKRLHPQFAREPEFVSMLLDEARLASRVQHPHVVSPSDVVSEAGEVYIVMDYVPGQSLAKLLKTSSSQGPAPTPEISARLIVDLLEGLHAAHEATGDDGRHLEIVHRDVSPQNVLVGRDGIARLIDFGIAKAAVRWQTTREGQIKGKLPYMSKEQLTDLEVDRRSDVYAASVVFWEMLTGKRLFTAKSDAALFGKVLEGAVLAPSVEGAPVSPSLDEIVLRGLSRDRDLRFPTAQSLAREIARAVNPASREEVVVWLREVAGDEFFSSRPSFSSVVDVATPSGAARSSEEDPTVADPPRVSEEGARNDLPIEPDPQQLATQASEAPPALESGGRRFAGAAIVLGLVGFVAWVLWPQPGAQADPVEALQGPTRGVAPESPPKGEASPADETAPLKDQNEPKSEPAEGSGGQPATQTQPTAPALKPATRAAPQVPRKPSLQAAPKKPDCSVPFVTGKDGIQRVRRECL